MERERQKADYLEFFPSHKTKSWGNFAHDDEKCPDLTYLTSWTLCEAGVEGNTQHRSREARTKLVNFPGQEAAVRNDQILCVLKVEAIGFANRSHVR